MRAACATSLLDPATGGTLTKCSSRSTDVSTISGGQLIRMMTCWISWSKAEDKKAAKKFFRKLLKELRYVPRVIITDKLRSYSAAKAEVLPGVEHCHDKWRNNRAENSHQPTRLRERLMRRFKSAGHEQRFLSAFGIITSYFRVGRHHYSAHGYREVRKSRFAVWQEVVCLGAIVN
jgi:putative transposase